MTQRKLGDRVGACLGRVAHGDAAAFRADFVDVVDADARANDDLEFTVMQAASICGSRTLVATTSTS